MTFFKLALFSWLPRFVPRGFGVSSQWALNALTATYTANHKPQPWMLVRLNVF